MFDKNQFQVNVLKEMLAKDTRFRRTQSENGFIGVTDGVYMIILHESEWKIKLDGLRQFDYDFSDAFKEHPALSDSRIRQSGPTVLAKLVSEDRKTVSYLNEVHLRKFKGCSFFSEGETAPIYVKDELGELIGLVMPMRCSDKERF